MKRVTEIFEQEAAAIRNIPAGNEYAAVVDLVYERVHRRGGKLITSGMGKAGQIALNIATTLSSTGTPAVSTSWMHPPSTMMQILTGSCMFFPFWR